MPISHRKTVSRLSLVLALGALSVPAAAKMPAPPAAAPLPDLVKMIDIPHQRFVLDNGLTVLVHEDRKAPIVAVSIWYGVGSKNEPLGKTGYAHLFEHIMFNGSENAPGDYFEYLKQLGATDFNGTTWLDRTNYFQTVPRSALESVLFLESDRMGHLLGGLTQEKLTNQIGVVQNEKRQGDNQPYGLVEYKQVEMLFPAGHPYGHSTIGSMADLKAATLSDMQQWFTGHYGPNNAVLVLAGDINAAEARPLVEKWFGAIPAGPKVAALNPDIPTLDAPKKAVMKDKVPVTRIYRNWVIPGLRHPDHIALDVAASVLGGLASSRLDKQLVRTEQNAVSVYAYTQSFVHSGLFEIGVDVKPGEDADKVAARLDAIMADFIANGPSEDEVRRVATSVSARLIAGLEQVGGFGGKAVTLAEGELYVGDPDFYKKQLAMLADMTPAAVQAAMRQWLTRPVAEIRVEPGERDAYDKAVASNSDTPPPVQMAALGGPAFYAEPGRVAASGKVSGGKSTAAKAAPAKAAAQPSAQPAGPDRKTFPQAGPAPDIDFPEVEETTLSNGMKLFFARRAAVPVVRVAVSFDAGHASDPADKVGLNALMTRMLDEGTTSLDATALAEAKERLGASLGASSDADRTVVSATALKVNLAPTIDLMADYIRNPAFAAKELERVKVQQLTRIKAELSEPAGMARRALPPLIYGAEHPYGREGVGLGTPEVVAKLDRKAMAAYHRSWIRPDRAEIFVVGDTSLAEIKPLLDKALGQWKAPRGPVPAKPVDMALPATSSRIVVIDRPQSPQSYILAAETLAATGKDDLLVLQTSNEILGGDFLSRINMDLRETKGWSYGTRSSVNQPDGPASFSVRAPVQADRTGDAVKAILAQINDYRGAKGVTPVELDRTIKGNRLELAGQYEQGSAILSQMQIDRRRGRPFNYVEGLAARYSALTAPVLGDAARGAIDPDRLVWVIVGDAKVIRPQLADIGMPVTYRLAEENGSGADAAAKQGE